MNSNDHIIIAEPGNLTHHKGIFYSSDNGNYWVQKGLTNVSVGALAVNLSDHIFVGTSNGILRSTDNGDTWVQLSLSNSISSLAINLSNLIFAVTNGGMFRSTDNGENWISINNGLPQGFNGICLAINSNGDIFLGGRKTIYPYWWNLVFR